MLRAFSILLLAAAMTGCVSKSSARHEAEKAYLRGQRDAVKSNQQQQLLNQTPSVTVIGNVANRVVPWTETLTVAQAIVLAQYLSPISPSAVLVHRAGQTYTISVRMLMSGVQDMPLEPGDVVELRK
ncbi:MAG: hypothetical protein HY301_05265 [Verrucomicrobia bacterium]|nr:hypothetical protein [Verrucomicrobiota bacterium]